MIGKGCLPDSLWSILIKGLVRPRALCKENQCVVSYIADLYSIEFGLQHQRSVSWHIHISLLFVPGIAVQWLEK